MCKCSDFNIIWDVFLLSILLQYFLTSLLNVILLEGDLLLLLDFSVCKYFSCSYLLMTENVCKRFDSLQKNCS